MEYARAAPDLVADRSHSPGNTTLQADNQVLLLAAANTATQTSDQKSSSGRVGVSLGKGKFGVTVSASQSSGDGNGQGLSYTNTQVQGGKTVNIQSGGDTALKITVQIPDTKGGQEIKSQINALASQSSGAGLDYLGALANNPNVKWDRIALAHEKWSYDQAERTPAGAALLRSTKDRLQPRTEVELLYLAKTASDWFPEIQ